MKTDQEIIRVDIALLLRRYGRELVLRSLAEQLHVTDDQLRSVLEKFLQTPEASPKRKKTKLTFDIEKILRNSDGEFAEALRELHRRYENRTFLPDLIDVRRFLEKRHLPARSLRSRDAAKGLLFKTIAGLSPTEVHALLEEGPLGREASSLGLISDAILGRERRD